MKRLVALFMALVSAFTAVTFAFAENYEFLDGMTLTELEALQTEVEKRINDARKQQAATDTTDYGMWELRYYVDDFNLPTDEGYVSNTEIIEGTFSNSATTNSLLYVVFLIDKDDVAIVLYEYGISMVKNYSSRNSNYYTVKVLDSDGVRHSLTARMNPNGNRLFFTSDSEEELLTILSANGTVRFYIAEDDGGDSYSFVIDNTAYFTNAYNARLCEILSVNISLP